MTDEQAIEFYNELVEYYGDRLVNFEHYPRIFMYQIKLYKYYKGISQ